MNGIPDSAMRDLVEVQVSIEAAYGEYIPVAEFEYIDGEWTLDGMEPFEWAHAVFGDLED